MFEPSLFDSDLYGTQRTVDKKYGLVVKAPAEWSSIHGLQILALRNFVQTNDRGACGKLVEEMRWLLHGEINLTTPSTAGNPSISQLEKKLKKLNVDLEYYTWRGLSPTY